LIEFTFQVATRIASTLSAGQQREAVQYLLEVNNRLSMPLGGTPPLTKGTIMTSSPGGNDNDATDLAGRKTGQHVSQAAEPETFTTDEPPTADTPAHGSTNAGINKLSANRPDAADEGGQDSV
jgi:hypothetical protein